jgi:hypothetical protein
MAMGEAAGLAAALALSNGVSPRQVNYADLQNSLLEQGVLLKPVEVNAERLLK